MSVERLSFKHIINKRKMLLKTKCVMWKRDKNCCFPRRMKKKTFTATNYSFNCSYSFISSHPVDDKVT